MKYLIIFGVTAFLLAVAWAWRQIPVLDCPRCKSLNTRDINTMVGRGAVCDDCGYQWGDSE